MAVNFRGDIGLESVPWREDHVALSKDAAIPIELLQARRAMDIARFLQVEKYAEAELKAAEETMAQAEWAYEQEQPKRAALLARQTIRQLEQARLLNQERLEAQLKRQKELELADVHHQLELTEKEAAQANALLKEVTAESEEKDRQLRQARATTDDLTARLQRREAQLEEAIRAQRRAQNQVAGAEERAAAAESRAAAAEQELNQMRATSIPVEEHQFKLRLARLGETYYNDEVFVVVLFNKDLFEETTQSPAAVLSESGKEKLDAIADSMLSYSEAFCGVMAHVERPVSVDVAMPQAETYATTVTAYLLSKGVPGDRLKPVNDQPSVIRSRRVSGQEDNSRVELIFVNKARQAGS